jgi:hypothetical protein
MPERTGRIGDGSFAGKTVRQYGTVLDSRQELYLLTDSDIETLLRWVPGGWRLPKLRGNLLADFHLPATDLPTLTWPDIIATLNTRSPGPPAQSTPAPAANEPAEYDGFCSPLDIAKGMNAPKQAENIRKALGKLRDEGKLPEDGWIENGNAKDGQVRYLYNLSKVRPFLARYEAK